MKMLLITTICLTVIACTHTSDIAQAKFVPPDHWKLINSCGVNFYVPPDMKEEKVHPIDSCVVQYRGTDILLTLDSIMYHALGSSRSSEYTGKREFSLRK